MGDRKAKKSGLNRCAVPCLSKEGGPCNPMQSGSFEQSIIVGDSHNDKCLLSKMATHTTQTSFWNKSVEEKYGRVRCRQHPKNHNTPQRKILSTMSSSLSNIRLNEPKISETEMKQVTEMNAKTISYPDSTSADSAWSTLLLLPGAESLSACIASSQISASLLSIKRIDFLRTLSLVAFFLFITSNLPSSGAAIFEQSKCETHGWNAFPVWKYRAKRRFVQPIKVDRHMQKEFLELFRGADHYDHDGSSSEEDGSHEEVPLDMGTIQMIADMCPRDAFFYSLSPKHSEAALALTRLLVAQPSPPDVLKLARTLLKSRLVNPKVWYYGVIGASQERMDMTGFIVAHPLDAMPDLFVPGHLLFSVMDHYRSGLVGRTDLFASNKTISKTKKYKKGKHSRIKRDSVTLSSRTTSTSSRPRNAVIKNVLRKRQVEDVIANVTRSTTATTTEATVGKIEIGQGKDNGGTVPLKGAEREARGMKHSIRSGIDVGRDEKKSGVRKYRIEKKKPAYSLKNKLATKKKPRPEGRRENITSDEETETAPSDGIWSKGRTDAFDDCLLIDGSIGLDNGIENKLWYFREDIMVNQHHWYWHQEYPSNTTMHRPRRAELFFYMHRNLVARYNAERLSNGMGRVHLFDMRPGAPISTAYDSKIADVNSGKFWTPRPHGVHLTDVLHMEDPDFERNIFVKMYNDLYGRLVRSVTVGHLLLTPFKTLKIRNTKGIEPLGNTVESSGLSVNPVFYDAMGFHNLGHQLIGLQTDPYFKARLPSGVMGDTAVTMRDPEFYTYHRVVDDLFDIYKKSLPPYQLKGGEYPLRWDGVEVLDIEVLSKTGGVPGQLRTFWSTKKFPLAPGVDQSIHKGDLDKDVCAVHLDHEPFDFKITVTLDPCAKTKTNKGTVRIFLAPRFDEHGHRLSLKEQRRLMLHMDSFPADLRVGKNIIYRRSYDSNLVTPWTKSIDEYLKGPKHPRSAESCGCGWPTHLYIPKGSHEGMPFDLFVMLTNFDHDYVEENPDSVAVPETCNSPYMYCGVKWRQYPDAKPMGYPFDRLPYAVPLGCPNHPGAPFSTLFCKVLSIFWSRPVSTLEEYVSYAPNMAATVVEIKHLDKLAW